MHHPYCPLLHREVLFLLPWEPPRFPRYEKGPSTKPLSKKICQVLHVSLLPGLCKRWLKGVQKCCSSPQSCLTDNCKHAKVCIGLNAGRMESEYQQNFCLCVVLKRLYSLPNTLGHTPVCRVCFLASTFGLCCSLKAMNKQVHDSD